MHGCLRARLHLAWVHVQRTPFTTAALQGRIAEAFNLDKTGEYRERASSRRCRKCWITSGLRHQQEYWLLINSREPLREGQGPEPPKRARKQVNFQGSPPWPSATSPPCRGPELVSIP